MNAWRPDRLLRVLLTWTSLTFLLAWLPFVRCVMDGGTYTWGFGWGGLSVGGTGISAQNWLPVVEVALGVTLLWLGSRGARMPFHWLLLAWHTALFTSFTYYSLTSPEDFRFRGDTAGIDFSLAWVGPVFTGGFLVASIFWVARDLRKPGPRQVAPWTRKHDLARQPDRASAGPVHAAAIRIPEGEDRRCRRRDRHRSVDAAYRCPQAARRANRRLTDERAVQERRESAARVVHAHDAPWNGA